MWKKDYKTHKRARSERLGHADRLGRNRSSFRKSSSRKSNVKSEPIWARLGNNLQHILTGKVAKASSLAFLVFVLVMTASVFVKLNRLSFPDREAATSIRNWDGRENLTTLLLGLDDKSPELEFADFIQLVYVQPLQGKANIISVNPELSINIAEINAVGKSVESIFSYKQLLNYYRNQHILEGKDATAARQLALQDFIYALEGDLGVRINRYVVLKKSQVDTLLSPLGSLYLNLKLSLDVPTEGISLPEGGSWYGPREQLQYVSGVTDNEDSKFQRQNDYTKSFISSLSSPFKLIGLGSLVLKEGSLTDLIQTNFSKDELWQFYGQLRGTSELNISTEYTAAKQTYLLESQRFLDRRFFDQVLQKYYRNQEVLLEQARVDVVNGSQKTGLANKTARLLGNYSLIVVQKSNALEAYTHNTLYVSDVDRYAATVKQLQQFYPDLQVKQEDYPYRQNGDMVLVVI